jgi:hypothetical protein
VNRRRLGLNGRGVRSVVALVVVKAVALLGSLVVVVVIAVALLGSQVAVVGVIGVVGHSTRGDGSLLIIVKHGGRTKGRSVKRRDVVGSNIAKVCRVVELVAEGHAPVTAAVVRDGNGVVSRSITVTVELGPAHRLILTAAFAHAGKKNGNKNTNTNKRGNDSNRDCGTLAEAAVTLARLGSSRCAVTVGLRHCCKDGENTASGISAGDESSESIL